MKIFSRALVVAASVRMCLVAWPRGLSAQITVHAAPKFSTSSPPQSDHEFTEDNGFIGGTASVTWNSLGSASTGVVWALDSNLSGILTDKGTYRAAGPAGLYIYPAIPPVPYVITTPAFVRFGTAQQTSRITKRSCLAPSNLRCRRWLTDTY